MDERAARRMYLTTYNTHKRHTSMPLAVFEPAIPASDRRQTLALDRSATGIGNFLLLQIVLFIVFVSSFAAS